MSKILEKNVIFKKTEGNFIDKIWTTNRPPFPMNQIFLHDIK